MPRARSAIVVAAGVAIGGRLLALIAADVSAIRQGVDVAGTRPREMSRSRPPHATSSADWPNRPTP